jgi:hypothetical protein
MLVNLPDKVYEANNILREWIISEYIIVDWTIDYNKHITKVSAKSADGRTHTEFSFRNFNTGLVGFDKRDIQHAIDNLKFKENYKPRYHDSVYSCFRQEVCGNRSTCINCKRTCKEIENCSAFENYYAV